MLVRKLNFIYKRFYKKTIFALFSVILIVFCGCVHHEPLNLTLAKERVEKYYECGQYDKELCEVTHDAIKHFKKVLLRKNATVIFDIDDTVLSDYADAKSISFGYVPKLSHEWVLRADAPAIQQTKNLYDYLVRRGFIIIFLTGRKHNEYDATIKNLRNQGFTTFEKLIVRQEDEERLTAEKFKSSRRKKLVEEGYRIVGCIGDQLSDLKGQHTGHKVKLPNVRYFIP
jgi:acid phosphatase